MFSVSNAISNSTSDNNTKTVTGEPESGSEELFFLFVPLTGQDNHSGRNCRLQHTQHNSQGDDSGIAGRHCVQTQDDSPKDDECGGGLSKRKSLKNGVGGELEQKVTQVERTTTPRVHGAVHLEGLLEPHDSGVRGGGLVHKLERVQHSNQGDHAEVDLAQHLLVERLVDDNGFFVKNVCHSLIGIGGDCNLLSGGGREHCDELILSQVLLGKGLDLLKLRCRAFLLHCFCLCGWNELLGR